MIGNDILMREFIGKKNLNLCRTVKCYLIIFPRIDERLYILKYCKSLLS